MSKNTPKVSKYMTAAPHTVRPDMTMEAAHKIMREHQIRHLPVLNGGQLLGLVSQRDLHLVESLKDVDPAEVTVEEAMSEEVYQVPSDTGLDEVAATMAEHRYGSAVIMEGGKVVGIFTAVDALVALAELLRK